MSATRYLFFTGKGGVGKTSVACATAINLSDSGKKVLLVSTDPASNLDDVLETRVGQQPTEIFGVTGLWALNLDPEKAARAYREQVVGSYRGVLPKEAITSIEEQLSGACTVEIAAFDLFTRLLTDSARVDEYDHIIFDTAPTGHTLRLLTLPKSWSGFLDTNVHGASCIGPLAGLQEQRQRYENTVSVLANPALTTLILVTRPEAPALTEAARASHELGELGLSNQQLVVNGVLETAGEDRVAAVFKKRQSDAMEQMPAGLKQLPRPVVPLLPDPPVGLAGLCLLAERIRRPGSKTQATEAGYGVKEAGVNSSQENTALAVPMGLGPVVADLDRRERGVVLVMGKGGVGKTTVAAAIALALAGRGLRVHLSTTDPAAHLDLTLAGAVAEAGERFSVSRIDPAVEVEAYRDEVMSTVGAGLDAEARALLAEDLASPCTKEIAVFRVFARIVDRVEEGFVVLDTAPTGHTLLLLDSTQSYHCQIERGTGEAPVEVRRLLPRLRDSELTHVLLVTLAQATPVLEAAHLQEDLRRAGIDPAWWVVNQTWTRVSTADPVLRNLSRAEGPWLEKVVKTLAERAIRIPWQIKEPKGRAGLAQLL